MTTDVRNALPPLGLHPDIPNDEYHRSAGVSSSDLRTIITQSPAHLRERKRHPRPSTDSMAFGTAFHTLVLEPERFAAECAPDPRPGEYSKAAKAEREELAAAGKQIIHTAKDAGHWDRDDWRTLHRMRDAVMADPTARILLDPAEIDVEHSGWWIEKIDLPTGRLLEFETVSKLCKLRFDARNRAHNVLVDLKSTKDASITGWFRDIADFRYHVQACHYTRGMFRLGEHVDDFIFVLVEKTPPYAVAVRSVPAPARRSAEYEWENALRTWAVCQRDDWWPAYGQGVQSERIPEWALRARAR